MRAYIFIFGDTQFISASAFPMLGARRRSNIKAKPDVVLYVWELIDISDIMAFGTALDIRSVVYNNNQKGMELFDVYEAILAMSVQQRYRAYYRRGARNEPSIQLLPTLTHTTSRAPEESSRTHARTHPPAWKPPPLGSRHASHHERSGSDGGDHFSHTALLQKRRAHHTHAYLGPPTNKPGSLFRTERVV
jgi:hypothetical protein